MPEIYGVDLNKPFTAKDVRDAIVRCFELAHQNVTRESFNQLSNEFSAEGMERLTKANIKSIVCKAFQKSGGDFDNPDRESLIGAIDYLRAFSIKYRSPEVIEKHYNEIMQLINKLK